MWHFLITDLLPPAEEVAEHLRPRLPGVEARLARGRREVAAPTWREELLALAGHGPLGDRDWPVGCDFAAAAGCLQEAAGWAVVAPVRLAAGLDHVQLERLAPALTPARVADFNRDFGADAGTLVPCGHVLLWALPRVLEARTHDPAGLVGHDIGPRLPTGSAATFLRRWMTEAQMWLHAAEDPGGANALWPWGLGSTAAYHGLPDLPWAVDTTDVWMATWPRTAADALDPRHHLTLWRLGDHAGPDGAFATADAIWTAEIDRALDLAGEVAVWLAGRRYRLQRRDRWLPWRRWHTPRPWWR